MKLVGNCETVIIREDLGSTAGDVPLPLALLYSTGLRSSVQWARQGQGHYRTTGLSPTHSLRFSSNNYLFRPPIKKHRIILYKPTGWS